MLPFVVLVLSLLVLEVLEGFQEEGLLLLTLEKKYFYAKVYNCDKGMQENKINRHESNKSNNFESIESINQSIKQLIYPSYLQDGCLDSLVLDLDLLGGLEFLHQRLRKVLHLEPDLKAKTSISICAYGIYILYNVCPFDNYLTIVHNTLASGSPIW